MAKSPYRIILLCCLVLLALGRLPSTCEPLSQDQAVFTLGGKLLLQGETLYRDVFDHKPPAMFFIYTPIYWIFGPSGLGCALIDLLLHLLQLVLLYQLLRKLADEETAAFSVIIFTFLLLAPVWSRGIRLLQAEVITNLLVLIMMHCCFSGRMDKGATILVGFCGAILFATKFLPLAFIVPPLLLLEKEELKSKRLWFYMSLGFFLGSLPWILYLSVTGAWSFFIAAVIHFNRCYAGALTNPPWTAFSAKMWALWLPLLLAMYESIHAKKDDSLTKHRYVPMIWLAISFFILFIQRKFFYYHFLVLLPPLSWLAALGILRIYRFCPSVSEQKRKLTIALTAIIILLQLTALSHKYFSFHEKYFFLRIQKDDFPAYAEKTQVTTNRTLLETVLLAAAIKCYSKPNEELMVWGMNPLLYLWADRKPATEYILHNWLLLDKAPFNRWGDSKKRRASFLKKMQEDPPACFVVATGDKSVLSAEDSYSQLRGDKELFALLKKNYRAKLRIRNSHLWVHRSKLAN